MRHSSCSDGVNRLESVVSALFHRAVVYIFQVPSDIFLDVVVLNKIIDIFIQNAPNLFFFNLNKLNITPIRNVSNEYIRSSENQKVLIFWYPLKKKAYRCNLSCPWGNNNNRFIKNIKMVLFGKFRAFHY